VSPLWGKATQAAEDARLLIRRGSPDSAISRAYYAVFTAARVLLVEREGYTEADIRRHSAVLRLFSEHFVKTGLLDREIGRRFQKLSQARASADYDPQVTSEDDARQALDFMERFLARVAELREQEPKP
jgi:uncharacterized protein (UPF0332 family)